MRRFGSLVTAAVSFSIVAMFVLPAVASAAGSVYVANYHSDSISQYTIASTGALSPMNPATAPTLPTPTQIAVSPDGRSAYVASFNNITYSTGVGSYAISQYDISPQTGALTPKRPAVVAAGHSDEDVVVSPDGKNVYAVNYGDNTVSQFNVKSGTGALSPKTPATVPTGTLPEHIVISHDGHSAYVVNQSSISQYNVNPGTGTLSPKTPASVATGFNANNIVLTPDDHYAYVTVVGYPVGIWQYAIDPATGDLSNSPTILAASGPLGMALSSNGQSAYVANQLENDVLQYNLDPFTGALSPKSPPTVATSNGVWIALSPDGASAYVTNYSDSTVSQYKIDPLTGTLLPMNPATVATGPTPLGITVGPFPANGKCTKRNCS
jgi:6-phosphogluconolactonase (cycloisomerase 2 family)